MAFGTVGNNSNVQDDVDQNALANLFDLQNKVLATNIVLAHLSTSHEIAIDNAASQEVAAHSEVHQWADRSVDNTSSEHERETCTTGANAVEVLILWLRFEAGCLRAATARTAKSGTAEKIVLDQVHIASQAHAMSKHLHDRVVQIEVCAERHPVGQEREDAERALHKTLHSAHQITADASDEQDKDDQEPKVPLLQF
jgi:hypothetical protein